MSSINGGSACPFCETGHLVADIREQEYQYMGYSTTIKQPGLYCFDCNEAILEPEHLKATRIELQAFRAQAEGLLGPLEIRRIRKLIGINQKVAGLFFGGGKNAFSRYEQGELSPPKAISVLFDLLDRHRELIDDIQEKVKVTQSCSLR